MSRNRRWSTANRGSCKFCNKKLWTRYNGYCSQSCAKKAKKKYNKRNNIRKYVKKCPICEKPIKKGVGRYCGYDCSKIGKMKIDRLYQLLFIKKDKKCVYCNRPLIFESSRKNEPIHDLSATKDHIIPKSRGGKDTIENLSVCCRRCNIIKGSKSIKALFRNKEFQEYAILD